MREFAVKHGFGNTLKDADVNAFHASEIFKSGGDWWDKEIDRRLVEAALEARANGSSVVIESKIMAHLLATDSPLNPYHRSFCPDVSIWLTAPIATSSYKNDRKSRSLSEAESKTHKLKHATERLVTRQLNDKVRYRETYGVTTYETPAVNNPHNLYGECTQYPSGIFTMVRNTGEEIIEQTFAAIVAPYRC